MNRSLLLLFALAGTACGEEYTHLRFDELTQPPLPVSISRRSITLYEGTAIAARAVPMDGDDPMEEPPEVQLRACDGEVAGVARAPDDRAWHEGFAGEDDRPPEEKARSFVIWGTNAGRSCLRVVLDGQDHGSITVSVLPHE